MSNHSLAQLHMTQTALVNIFQTSASAVLLKRLLFYTVSNIVTRSLVCSLYCRSNPTWKN